MMHSSNLAASSAISNDFNDLEPCFTCAGRCTVVILTVYHVTCPSLINVYCRFSNCCWLPACGKLWYCCRFRKSNLCNSWVRVTVNILYLCHRNVYISYRIIDC